MRRLVRLFVAVALLYSGAISAVVLWHNESDGITTSPGITADVYNDDIDVIGTNALVDGIAVVASAVDVLITITNGDAVITGSGNRQDGVPTGSARLYLYAATSRTITFSLSADLLFRGTATNVGTSLLDLLISASGGGNIVFSIAGDHTVTFTSFATTGGALFYVAMNNPEVPDVTFERLLTDAVAVGEDVEVAVGPRSTIGYLSENSIAVNGGAGDAGVVLFDTTNSGTGRMILRVDNSAQVQIAGRLLDGVGIDAKFQIGDIDVATPAGFSAEFEVRNNTSLSSGSLLVINHNKRPTQLLIDPWCDSAFTGSQYGFILGANGVVGINANAYLDYVGLTTNYCPTPTFVIPVELVAAGYEVSSFVKERNASAFIIDGNANPNAVNARIELSNPAALYLRSGADNLGNYQEKVDGVFSFTVNAQFITPGAGNLILSAEGDVDVRGSGGDSTALHILSLQVDPTGGPIYVQSGETIFPLRTFATNPSVPFISNPNDTFLRYNSAYMQINKRMNLQDATIVHDDQNHVVFEKNFRSSEPTYVGGDSFNLVKYGICSGNENCFQQRPKITFLDAFFRVNTDVAFTGVDLLVPNSATEANNTTFVFYGNGRVVDSGNGRQFNLGTKVGSFSCDGTPVDGDSHLDIMQELSGPALTHQLSLDVAVNDDTVNNAITQPPAAIEGQPSVHTIYLGNNSNISIGTNDTVGTDSTCQYTFALTTFPHLLVNGCYFSIDTQGGVLCLPETSNVTGQGGIFIDSNGFLSIAPRLRMNISAMVTKSHNGTYLLPADQVFFNKRVGLAEWQLLLSGTLPTQNIIIPSTATNAAPITDYTIDWPSTIKDYTSTNSLVPYEMCDLPVCDCPPIRAENIRGLPEVRGVVEQLQIKRSRLGDFAQFKVGQGGFVRELVFLTGYDSSEVPTGLAVIEGNGRLGLGSARRYVDSVQAAIVLGVNGVTLVPNGNGQVEVNDDLLINNICHILSGTAFGLTGQNFLTFDSDIPREIRVKSGAVLDLSSLTTTNQVVQFSGKLNLVFETGSALIMGGGILQFIGDSRLVVEAALDDQDVVYTSVASSDSKRVRVLGTGTIRMRQGSTMRVIQEASIGIEASHVCTPTTNILWTVEDQASIIIGDDEIPGGVFQVGNTTSIADSSVTFTLLIDGIDATFVLGQDGYLGLGAGIINKPFESAPNTWTIGSLFDVNSININVNEGSFVHNEILPGTSDNATLLALGGSGVFSFNFSGNRQLVADAQIRGGGNLVAIAATVTSIVPTVTTYNGVISSDLQVGIMGSRGHLVDAYSANQPVGVSANALFDYLRVRKYGKSPTDPGYASPKACLSRNSVGTLIESHINPAGALIARTLVVKIIGQGGYNVDPDRQLLEGAVNLILNADGTVAQLIAFVQ